MVEIKVAPPRRVSLVESLVRLSLSVLLCLASSSAAPALTFEFPGPAVTTTETQPGLTSYSLPTGPWQPGGVPGQISEGVAQKTAWRVEAPGMSTLALMAPLRDQLVAAGYAPVFECETSGCGGFDFRFEVGILPEPDMHVDLGDFRFLSAARHTGQNPDVVSLLVSRSATSGYVQMTRVTPSDTPAGTFQATEGAPAIAAIEPSQPATTAITLSTATSPVLEGETKDVGAKLVTGGALVLDGLQFESGAAALTAGRYASLAGLAEWLLANPDKTVALVGHTDASGGLDVNISLSLRRAESVRKRLMEAYDIPASQIEAEGVGYLSPRDTNLTEEGRTNNRRVEAILTSTR